MDLTSIQAGQLRNTNKLLAAFSSGKILPGTPVSERSKMAGMVDHQYYLAIKRLKVLKRIRKDTLRADTPIEVIDSTPMTIEDYFMVIDPYNKRKRLAMGEPSSPRTYKKKRKYKKRGPKKKAVVKATPILEEPIVIATDQLVQRDVSVSITGAPDSVAALLTRIGHA